MEITRDDKILLIKFNNAKKKNALSNHIYGELAKTLQEASTDDSITVIVITGAGDFFTSGNDLTQTPNEEEMLDMQKYLENKNMILKSMITALIECPKLLIALVNGPSIGIGTTITALCDLVWCAETAYFRTPFTELGLVPEACSSYVLPIILGRSKATELLLLSERMTAEEALQFNFVSRIFKISELNDIIWPKIREFSNLPTKSLSMSKQLIRMHWKRDEYKAMNAELIDLLTCLQSEEFMQAISYFAAKRYKSKL